MTQMEDNALNKDHSKTTSMPTNMAELGSGNFDQELTLSLLGSEKDALDQIDRGTEADRRRQLWAVRDVRHEDPQAPALKPSLMRPCASDVPHNGKKATGPNLLHPSADKNETWEAARHDYHLLRHYPGVQRRGLATSSDAA